MGDVQIWFKYQIVKYHIIIISLAAASGIQLKARRVKIENIYFTTRRKIWYFILFQVASVRARRRTGWRTWWRGRTWCWSAGSPRASAPAPARCTGSGRPTTTTTTWPSGRRPSAPDTREYWAHRHPGLSLVGVRPSHWPPSDQTTS